MMNIIDSDPKKRFATLEIIALEVYGQMGEHVAKMKNLSKSGAFLEVVKGQFSPQKGDLIRMKVTLSSLQKTHQVDAEVVWTQEKKFGVTFVRKEELVEKMLSKSILANF
ncbi:MAG: PilZ domain-containing protein [Pseudobdellovibrionaceae bacterium]